MRELCVYYCPKCGRYGFYIYKRRAICPQCDDQMEWLSVDYTAFCHMGLDERDYVIAQAMLRHAAAKEQSNHPVLDRIAAYEKAHNNREIIGQMNEQLTDLQKETKRLSDTVEWMHKLIYDLIKEKRALEQKLNSPSSGK